MIKRSKKTFWALGLSACACLAQNGTDFPENTVTSNPPAAGAPAPSSQGVLTLDQAIRLALENNYALSLSRDQTDLAVSARQGGVGNFLPSASADVNNSGPLPLDGNVPVTTVGASVNWLVFDGLQDYHGYRILQTQEKAAMLQERLALEGLMESVEVAYYDLVQQKQKLSAISDLMAVSLERASLAQAKLDVGAGSKLDQLQSRADLNEDSSSYLNQTLSLQTAKVRLNQVLARDPALEFEVVDSIPLESTLPLDDWRKGLPENNAAIAAARTEKTVSSYSLDAASGRWFPSLSAGISYSATPDALNSARATELTRDGFSYGVNLSIPLFDKLATPTAVRQAKLNLRGDDIRLRQTIDQVAADFEQARRQYETGRREISLEERNLQVARLQAEAALERYKLGASSPLEFRDAQTKLLDAEGRLITARQSAKQAEAALQRLSGVLIRQAPVAAARTVEEGK